MNILLARASCQARRRSNTAKGPFVAIALQAPAPIEEGPPGPRGQLLSRCAALARLDQTPPDTAVGGAITIEGLPAGHGASRWHRG